MSYLQERKKCHSSIQQFRSTVQGVVKVWWSETHNRLEFVFFSPKFIICWRLCQRCVALIHDHSSSSRSRVDLERGEPGLPGPHSQRTRGYLCSFPITWTPNPYLGYWLPLATTKNTPFSWFSRESFPRLRPKNTPFPRKWDRPPYAFGGPGLGWPTGCLKPQTYYNTSRWAHGVFWKCSKYSWVTTRGGSRIFIWGRKRLCAPTHIA